MARKSRYKHKRGSKKRHRQFRMNNEGLTPQMMWALIGITRSHIEVPCTPEQYFYRAHTSFMGRPIKDITIQRPTIDALISRRLVMPNPMYPGVLQHTEAGRNIVCRKIIASGGSAR